MPAAPRYRAAIAGCGKMGSDYDSMAQPAAAPKSHAGAYRSHPGFDLVAGCDPSPEARARFAAKWSVSAVYDDIVRMLDREDIDVLSITGATASHAQLLDAALASDVRVVFIEKPVCSNYAQALAMRQRVTDSGKAVIVNYSRRWNSDHRQLKTAIDSGELGPLQKAVVSYTVGMIHNGSHAIDLIRWYFGPIQRVWGIGEARPGTDALIDACFETAAGGRVYLHGYDRRHWNIMEIDLLMAKGRYRFARGGRIVERFGVVADPDFAALRVLDAQPASTSHAWPMMLLNAVDDIYRLLQGRGEAACTFDDGAQALGWAETAIDSAAQGGRWRALEKADAGKLPTHTG